MNNLLEPQDQELYTIRKDEFLLFHAIFQLVLETTAIGMGNDVIIPVMRWREIQDKANLLNLKAAGRSAPAAEVAKL